MFGRVLVLISILVVTGEHLWRMPKVSQGVPAVCIFTYQYYETTCCEYIQKFDNRNQILDAEF